MVRSFWFVWRPSCGNCKKAHQNIFSNTDSCWKARNPIVNRTRIRARAHTLSPQDFYEFISTINFVALFLHTYDLDCYLNTHRRNASLHSLETLHNWRLVCIATPLSLTKLGGVSPNTVHIIVRIWTYLDYWLARREREALTDAKIVLKTFSKRNLTIPLTFPLNILMSIHQLYWHSHIGWNSTIFKLKNKHTFAPKHKTDWLWVVLGRKAAFSLQ